MPWPLFTCRDWTRSSRGSDTVVVAAVGALLLLQDAYVFQQGTGVMWYRTSVKPIEFRKNPFRHMAAFFSIWHEPLRGTSPTADV